MLLELDVQNIALAESLSIEFGPGFNVLTGETGAGKSIVVDCMNLVLGSRTDRNLIRTGNEKAVVSAIFDISSTPDIERILTENGIDFQEDTLIITREISRNGRNTVRINGVPVTLTQLHDVTSNLIDVHGQHEHQQLLDSANHLQYLDSFGGNEARRLLSRVRECYAARAAYAAGLKKKIKLHDRLSAEKSLNEAKIRDIEELKLKAGEKEKLEKRLELLSSSEAIREKLSESYELLYGGDQNGNSIQSMLGTVIKLLEALENKDPSYAETVGKARDAYYILQDVSLETEKLREGIDNDPKLLMRIQDRLEAIYRLEKRYNCEADDLIAFAEKNEADDRELERLREEIKDGKSAYKLLEIDFREACRNLTEYRNSLVQDIETQVAGQLADLGMEKCRFSVEIVPLEKPNANGAEEVVFMISANVGEPLKPLSSVASGGELSRLMLALKTVTGGKGADSMVFDEIDTGISGKISVAVGEKMKAISRSRQVICVTHHASIAAMADRHYLVEKSSDTERTRSSVCLLERTQRIDEIVRLIDGGAGGETSKELATRMLDMNHFS